MTFRLACAGAAGWCSAAETSVVADTTSQLKARVLATFTMPNIVLPCVKNLSVEWSGRDLLQFPEFGFVGSLHWSCTASVGQHYAGTITARRIE